MGYYRNKLFPRLMHRSLDKPLFHRWRNALLTEVRGAVLEIGGGTGLNIDHYPSSVESLLMLDNNPGMVQAIQSRSAKNGKVKAVEGSAEKMPAESGQYDWVVSTFTLCSVDSVPQVVSEVIRVLKPGGHFLWLEHGSAKSKSTRFVQKVVEPLQKCVGDGCSLTRSYLPEIEAAGMIVLSQSVIVEPRMWSAVGTIYKGQARKE